MITANWASVRGSLGNAPTKELDSLTLNEESTFASCNWLQFQRMNLIGQLTPYWVHDALQPLTAICNYSSGMLARITDSSLATSQLSDGLTEINQEAFRASAKVKQLTKNSVADFEEITLVSMNSQVLRALDLVSGFLRTERVNISTDLMDGLPKIPTNPDGLEQVLLNLIKNAVEAMQALPVNARSVEISTREARGSIQITVEDSGSWIPDELVANLGCPFFTTKPNAMGMGLWASKRILNQLGGELLFQRKSTQGLQALVHLPVLNAYL